MRILITGKQGQVVQALVQRGAEIGVEVRTIGRPEMDMADPVQTLDAMRAAITALQPTLIVNAAAYTAVDQAEDEPELAFAINASSAGAVAQAAAEAGLPIVQISTDYVFDGTKVGPYVETDTPNPQGVYGASKLAGEIAVRTANPRHLIFRTSWVYSPFGKNFVKTMLRLAENRDEISVVADQFGNPTSAFDIADGIFAAARRIEADPGTAAWGAYHLAGAITTHWAGFAKEIFSISAAHSGPTATVKPITTADYPTKAKRPANSQLGCDAFEAAFGWRANASSDTLKITIAAIMPNDQVSKHSPKVNEILNPKAAKRTCILVLGMHRSGTSAVTRVLNLMGAALPKEIMPPVKNNNEAGFWEPMRLSILHDQMLTEVGSSWDDWRNLDLTRLSQDRYQHYKAELTRLVGEEYNDEPLFVLKDPRICRFVPFYCEVFGEMGIEIRPILTFRNPLAVAASLKARDGMVTSQAQLYWLRYILNAEASTRNLPRAVVSYEDLLKDWRNVIGSAATQLGLEWPQSLDKVATEINGFLNPAHQHNAASMDELVASNEFTTWVLRTYVAIGRLMLDPVAAMAELDQVGADFNIAAGALGVALASERSGHQRELDDLRARMSTELAEAQHERETANLALAKQKHKNAEDLADIYRKADAERTEANLAFEQSLSSQIIATQMAERLARQKTAELQETLNSTSWRMTSPMRAVSRGATATVRIAASANVMLNRLGGFKYTLNRAYKFYRRNGLQPLLSRLRLELAPNQNASLNNSYDEWVKLHDTLTPADLDAMRAQSKRFALRPLISVILPTFNTPAQLLKECIESVLAQTYDNWELCIADDASTHAHVSEILKKYAKQDQRIKVVIREKNGYISRASNSALELATGEWVALLDHDDEIRPHALYEIVKAINGNPHAKLFYSDEDKIDINGVRNGPYFKSDWNYDLFLSHNLITHLGVYNARLIRAIGGFRPDFDGAQDYDLALRAVARIDHTEIVHVPHVLYHWRQIPGSTALDSDEKPYAMLAGERALNAHLIETQTNATAKLMGFGFRVKFDLPDPQPSVSIIIPTRNGIQLLRQCIGSIQEKTSYFNYQIVVIDNGSDDPIALAYLEGLEQRQQAIIIRDPSEFNYSKLNNIAVSSVDSEYIVLLNNDVEVITPDWLEELIGNAIQPGVGAVGAMLYYPNNTIQHAGVIMGLGGYAAHAHHGFPRGTPGYVGRAALRQSYSAVTAACLAVKREHYMAVGGLDAKDFKIAYNDVDFCLKLKSIGLRNIWTPFAELYHYESATRGYETTPEKLKRFDGEKAKLASKWSGIIHNDPAYSPNLTTDRADFGLAFPPRKALFRD